MSKNVARIAQEFLEVREQLAELERVKSQIEAELKEYFASSGADSYVSGTTRISLVEGERPKYDAHTLQRIVSPALFKKLIKNEVDGKKFKSALELGLITEETAEAVTTITPYSQLRVTDLNKGVDNSDDKTKVTTNVA